MTKVLVTGGSGFIGQHLVSNLVAGGRQVRVLDLRSPACALPEVQYVIGSVLDESLVHESLREIEQVYHLAGLPGMWTRRKTDFHAVNYSGTRVVISAAQRHGVGRFLHCSSESILLRSSPLGDVAAERRLLPADDMPGPYTRSKMLAEQFALQAAASGFPLVVGTPTMPIGPHDQLTPPTAMLLHFLSGRIQLYIDFVMNLVDVRDVAAGLILAMERGQLGHRYILGSENISLKSVLNRLSAISGRRKLHIPVHGSVAEKAAAMLEFIADYVTHSPPSGTAEGVRIALRAKALSIEKAQRELGYAPQPIEPALRATIEYLIGAVGRTTH
jgi:dihydroflavonol-4-reductase